MQGRGGAGLVASASGDALFVLGGFAGHELNDMHRCDLGTRTWDCPDCCTGAQSCVFTPLHELPSSKLLSQAACASMTSSEMSTVARALLVARHTGASESQGLTM